MIITAKESIVFRSAFRKTRCFAKAVNKLISQTISLFFLSLFEKRNRINQIELCEIA